MARGWRFEMETTSPVHKADLEAQAADPSVPTLAWTLPTLRKAWNQAKAEVAPWWPSCSKEAYASGIAELVTALHHREVAEADDTRTDPRWWERNPESGYQ
jgi:hypothetical protein